MKYSTVDKFGERREQVCSDPLEFPSLTYSPITPFSPLWRGEKA